MTFLYVLLALTGGYVLGGIVYLRVARKDYILEYKDMLRTSVREKDTLKEFGEKKRNLKSKLLKRFLFWPYYSTKATSSAFTQRYLMEFEDFEVLREVKLRSYESMKVTSSSLTEYGTSNDSVKVRLKRFMDRHGYKFAIISGDWTKPRGISVHKCSLSVLHNYGHKLLPGDKLLRESGYELREVSFNGWITRIHQ